MASDSDSDEDFVTYGTPLEPLEEGGVSFMISVICLLAFKKSPRCLKQSVTSCAVRSATSLSSANEQLAKRNHSLLV